LQIATPNGLSGWVAGRYVAVIDGGAPSPVRPAPKTSRLPATPPPESAASLAEQQNAAELPVDMSASETPAVVQESAGADGSFERTKSAPAPPASSPFLPVAKEAAPKPKSKSTPSIRVFRRMAEPRENAFTLLVPKGWLMEGGIFRLDPTRAGGPRNAIEAKIDLALKNDASGRVMIRRLPDWYFCDVRHMPAGQMGLFPPGSNYQGMTVLPVMSAETFIRKVVIPKYHPSARNLKVVEVRPMPEPARKHQKRAASLILPLQVQCDAALVTVTYDEGGVRFKENIYTLIENKGAIAAGEWANRETGYARAPESAYAAWEPVFHTVMRSVRLNPRWVNGEVRGMLKRADILQKVQGQIQEIDRQILDHQQRTNTEIQNDMYLTLTGQEEYINPYTKEVEVDSGELGRYRWQTEGGDILFSDRETFDPNPGGVLNRTDWRRSQIRPRFPQ